MKISRVSSAPYRPHVTRVSRRSHPSIHLTDNGNFRSISMAKLSSALSTSDRSHIIQKSQRDNRLMKSDKSVNHTGKQDGLRSVRRNKSIETRISGISKLSRMLSNSSHRRITPINKRELGSLDQATRIDSRNSKTNLTNTKKSISIPIFNDRSNLFDLQQQNNKRKKQRMTIPRWIWFCCLPFTALLLAIIAGTLLALLLSKSTVTTTTTITTTTSTSSTSTSATSSTSTSSTSSTSATTTTSVTTSTSSSSTTSSTSSTTATTKTTSTTSQTTATTTSTSTSTSSTTTTTTVTTCNGVTGFSSGILATQSGKIPSSWTQYNYSYVAATTSPILIFAFTTNINNNYFLDTVSVTKITAPSIELLQNPSFDNSTTQLNGWISWCNSTCSAGAGGAVTYGTNCYMTTGNCFLVDCPDTGSGAMIFLGQAFSAVVGSTYTISFRLRMAWSGGPFSLTQFTAAIE